MEVKCSKFDNKICSNIEKIQDEIKKLARQVELIIVLGNGIKDKTFYELAIRECNNAMLVERPEDLYLNYVKRFKKVGVIVGTSASGEMVDSVVELLKSTETEGYMYEGSTL